MGDYGRILEIYRKSFPKVEQFPIWLLRIDWIRSMDITIFQSCRKTRPFTSGKEKRQISAL